MDFNALNNITPFVLNETLINDSTQVISNIAENADPASGGYYGLIIMIAVYIVTAYFLYRDDEMFRLDFIKASMYGSFIALAIGIFIFTLGFMSEFRHLVWMFLVFFASFIASYFAKQTA